MKIGYGLTTTPKRYDPERDYFGMCEKESICYLHNDKEELGMATAKNRCIKFLYDNGCDYILLMDDDTKILNPDLGKWLIEAYKETGIRHFTYPGKSNTLLKQKAYKNFIINQWKVGGGVLLFITREVVEKVGFLNVNYKSKWGHSHIGWSIRILKAGLMPGFKGWRLSPEGIKDYFFSEDIDGSPIIENYSKIEKDRAMKDNAAMFRKESTGKQIYYPYQERQ